MKKLLFLTCFIVCALSVKSQKFSHEHIRFDSVIYMYDTIKVRIQIDDGPGIAVLINGYLRRKFMSWGHLHPWGKIFSKDAFMDEHYVLIDPIRVWDYKEREWQPGERLNGWFLMLGSGIISDTSKVIMHSQGN